MNDATAEILAVHKKVYETARMLLKKNLDEMREVKEVSTFVAPLIAAAKMFLSKTGLSREDQKKVLLELVEKLGVVEGEGPPMYLG